MIKSIFTSFVFLLIVNLISAQKSYKVLYVKGTIIHNEKTLLKGDIIYNKDKIYFENNKGVIKVCYSNCTKIKVISGKAFEIRNKKTLESYYESMASRSDDEMDNSIDRIKEHSKIGIVDEFCLPINNGYKLDKNHFFYLRYKLNKEDINKKLIFKKKNLIINKNKLHLPDLNSSQNSFPFSLYYYNNLKEESELIFSRLFLVILDVNSIKSDLSDVLEDKSLSFKEKKYVLKEYLQLIYPTLSIGKIELEKIIKY